MDAPGFSAIEHAPTPPGTTKPILPAGATRIHLDYLDGVRGLAALYVMAHHLWRSYVTVALPGFLGYATNWLLYGHLAVDVFIVLSGFCLMLPVARAGSLRGGWQRFYPARCRRILPPMYFAIALGIIVKHSRGLLVINKAVILANVLVLQDIWQSANVVDGPLWSVALEWKIYFLFPLFVWLWLRYGVAVVVVTAAILSALFFALLAQIPAVETQAHCCSWYVFLFALGMLSTHLAVQRQDILRPVVLTLLCVAAFLLAAATIFAWPITAAGEDAVYVPHLPWIDSAVGIAFAALLTILGRKALRGEKSLLATVLAWRPFVFVGAMAYSLYLVHGILVYPVRNRLEHLHLHGAALIIPLDMVIVTALAYGFHLACERPFMSKPAPRTERQAEIAAMVNPAP